VALPREVLRDVADGLLVKARDAEHLQRSEVLVIETVEARMARCRLTPIGKEVLEGLEQRAGPPRARVVELVSETRERVGTGPEASWQRWYVYRLSCGHTVRRAKRARQRAACETCRPRAAVAASS